MSWRSWVRWRCESQAWLLQAAGQLPAAMRLPNTAAGRRDVCSNAENRVPVAPGASLEVPAFNDARIDVALQPGLIALDFSLAGAQNDQKPSLCELVSEVLVDDARVPSDPRVSRQVCGLEREQVPVIKRRNRRVPEPDRAFARARIALHNRDEMCESSQEVTLLLRSGCALQR